MRPVTGVVEKFEQVGHGDGRRHRVDKRVGAHSLCLSHPVIENNADFPLTVIEDSERRDAAGQHPEGRSQRLRRREGKAAVRPDALGELLQVQRRREKVHRHKVELPALVFDHDVLDGKLPLTGIPLREAFGGEHGFMFNRLGRDAKLVEEFEKGAVIVHRKTICGP